MPLLTWKPELEIGIPSVDKEHRDLIDMINSLHDSLSARTGAENVAAVLDGISARLSAHFAHEEKEMRQTNYDEFADHQNEHRKLLAGIRDIMNKVEEDDGWDFDEELGTRLYSWFAEHFRSKDSRLHYFLENIS